MIYINYKGRLGNNLTQYVLGRLISDKYKVMLESPMNRSYRRDDMGDPSAPLDTVDWSTMFKEHCTYEKKTNTNKRTITDDSYTSVLHEIFADFSDFDWQVDGFFQREDILCGFRREILDMFNSSDHVRPSDQVFIHYRLGDLIWAEKRGLGKIGHKPLDHDYYIRAIDECDFSTGYISTDSPENWRVQDILSRYNVQLFQDQPVETIQFARQFNNLILSHGQMSYWMAYLSKAENITIPFNHPVSDINENIYSFITK